MYLELFILDTYFIQMSISSQTLFFNNSSLCNYNMLTVAIYIISIDYDNITYVPNKVKCHLFY